MLQNVPKSQVVFDKHWRARSIELLILNAP
jgi:hypothetical protein